MFGRQAYQGSCYTNVRQSGAEPYWVEPYTLAAVSTCHIKMVRYQTDHCHHVRLLKTEYCKYAADISHSVEWGQVLTLQGPPRKSGTDSSGR